MALFDEFKKSFDAGEAQLDAAQQQLAKLKIGMLSFSSLPPRTCLATLLTMPDCA